MGRVEGKVALISGAARGMGAESARTLVAEGAKVVIGDILEQEGEAVAAELGENARFVKLDVTSAEDWDNAVQTAVDSFGGLDVLVNNAGILNMAPIEDYTIDDWNAIIGINLTGPFLGIKAAVAALKKSGRASIINFSSTAGLKGYASMSGYNASKWGVRGLTKSVALDLGKHGIRVNSLHPGGIKTPMTAGMEDFPQDSLALGRMGEPTEIAKLVLFLASDESSYSTGAEFIADGGESVGSSQGFA